MTISEVQIALRALVNVDASREGLKDAVQARKMEKIEFFRVAVYVAHMMPFGSSTSAEEIWHQFGQATTVN